MKRLYLKLSDVARIAMSNLLILLLSMVSLVIALASCESLDDSIGSDPYGGGKQPLGIKLLSDAPTPASGVPGDTIMFKAAGLLQWCDPASGCYDFTMYMGEEPAEIVTATDTTLFVKVPQELSTGITYLVLQNQVFYGPTFTVDGNLSIDKEFGLYKNKTQFSGTIYDAVESNQKSQGGTFYLVGDLKCSVEKNICRSIALLDANGNITTQRNSYFNTLRGSVYSLLDAGSMPYARSISLLKDNRMLISGNLSNMYLPLSKDQMKITDTNNYLYINNMALLSTDACLDSLQMVFSESYNGSKNILVPVPSFNGGFKQEVLKSFATHAASVDEQKVIAIGNFTQYATIAYDNSYASSNEVISRVGCVCRLNLDGSIDASYRPVATHTGANGSIVDAYVDEDNGVVLIGNFTTFDGVAANGVVRLDANGNVDTQYMANVGSGFNGSVTKVRYNEATHSAIFVGRFTEVGGFATQYIAKIGKDGQVDSNFKVSGFEGGVPTFGCIVSKQSPKVVVAGTFNVFKGVHRRGFLVLDMDGNVTQKFNVPGAFEGEIYQVKETVTSLGEYGLLLLGNFDKFNGEVVNNAIMLQADFE